MSIRQNIVQEIKQQNLQEILNAFLGLFTQPFEQSLEASVRFTVTAILLVFGISGLQSLFDFRFLPVIEGEFAAYSLVLVVVWMLLTSILHKSEDRSLALARNLSILSFWIAGMLVVVLLVNILFPNPLYGALRRLIASTILILLIFIHMLRNLPFLRALMMTFFLSISTVFLAHVVL